MYELRPKLEWHKGKAVLWLLQALDLDRPDVVPFYLGDDETDEDAFRTLVDRGIGVMVAEDPGVTSAHYLLRDPDEAQIFLDRLIDTVESTS